MKNEPCIVFAARYSGMYPESANENQIAGAKRVSNTGQGKLFKKLF
ncbi:hypothetical protein [Neobacillus muris]|nr:hypothetical protein [Neobacillus muris]